jgi:hypothetical protein
MKQYTPNGLSIDQLKKDAKKNKKYNKTTLSIELDKIATSKTNFSSWKSLYNQSHRYSNTIFLPSIEDVNNKYNNFSIYKNRPLLSVISQPSYCSTHIIKKIVKNINNKNNIFYADIIPNLEMKKFFLKNNYLVNYSFFKEFNISLDNSEMNNEKELTSFFDNIFKNINNFNFIILNELQRISYLSNFNYLFNKLIKKCSYLNIPILLITQSNNDIIHYIKKYSSTIIFPLTSYLLKHDKNLINYYTDSDKLSQFYKNELIDFKYYNFVNQDKINISIRY